MSSSSVIRIGTHNGTFHCDEVLACSLLKILPRYQNAEIIRTRDPKVLAECDTVVDVGGVFDASQRRFDHHQRTFTDTFHTLDSNKPWTIRLSSAGLIYFHYGREILRELLKKETHLSDDEKIRFNEILFDKLYEKFVQEIDAIDNGIDIADNMRYRIQTNLSHRVSFFNPKWNEENSSEYEESCFKQAMAMVSSELFEHYKYFVRHWWPARSLLEKAIDERFQIDPSGAILRFETSFPWREHLFDIENEQKATLGDSIKFVLYADQSQSWRIQAIPLNETTYKNRLPLPEIWQGLRDNELSEKSGIPGCIFVHANGFIGGNLTYDGALAMARRTLEMAK